MGTFTYIIDLIDDGDTNDIYDVIIKAAKQPGWLPSDNTIDLDKYIIEAKRTDECGNMSEAIDERESARLFRSFI